MSGPGQGGPARGYRWADATPGNTLAMVHGAKSERRITPVADRIEAELLAGEDCPPYLRADMSYRPAIRAYARAQACVELLVGWLDEHDITDALADHEDHEETEETTKGSATRRGSSRRVQSALDALHKHQTRAATLASRLGLDPASRAKISRDLSQSRWFAGQPRPLDIALAQIAADRDAAAAIEAGSDGG